MWASLHGHDFLSLLDGLSSPLQNFERAIDVGLYGLAITNHGNVSSAMKTLKSRNKYIENINNKIEKTSNEEDKQKLYQKIETAKQIKLCIGCEFYIEREEKQNEHLVVLAKNKEGWKHLIKLVSEASKKENFYRKPRLKISQFDGHTKDLIAFSGHVGSSLSNILFSDINGAYNATSYDEAKSFVRDDWQQKLYSKLDEYLQIFGRENFLLEIQIFDQERMPAQTIIAKTLRWLAKRENLRTIATDDHHYANPNIGAIDQRVLLCSSLRTTLPKVKQALAKDEEVALSGFFRSDKYYIPAPEEIAKIHTEEELANSILVADECEQFSLENKPTIPQFNCPNNLSSDEYLRQLCREGWKEKGLSGETYVDRVKYELKVLGDAGLSDYFLLVRDIVNSVKNSGGLVGSARGSVAGSLVAYLLGITSVDSIKYNLLFERFYNSGRNSPGRISLPDIDMDIQASRVDKTIDYVKEKYGKTKVGAISTYGRLMGRACLKEVLRVHESMSFDEMNRCSKFIPDFAAVAGEIELMKDDMEDGEEPSLILWSLQNNKKELSEWCYLDETGKCQGPFAAQFEQAIRLEGTYKSIGEHAAGIVIFPEDLDEIVPVIYDKEGGCKIAMDMGDIESLGGVKMDILSLKALDCVADSQFDICNNFLKDL